MRFIVIEGLDGSGKSTQIKFVEKYFSERNQKTRFIHFPRTDSPIWGELISRFLRGEFGDIETVDPYLVSLIYAGDRNDAAKSLNEWMDDGFLVIADRYLYSNIAFQCAKIESSIEKEKLAKWIKHLEYNYYNIPVPDLNLYLNVPFQFTSTSLAGSRSGEDRTYLNGAADIHESDLEFQRRVRDIYLWQVASNDDFEMIDCSDEEGNMLDPEQIAPKIIYMIENKS